MIMFYIALLFIYAIIDLIYCIDDIIFCPQTPVQQRPAPSQSNRGLDSVILIWFISTKLMSCIIIFIVVYLASSVTAVD